MLDRSVERIFIEIMQIIHLVEKQVIDMREKGGRIIIEPIRRPEFDLELLTAEITSENLYEEVDFGAPVGREIW